MKSTSKLESIQALRGFAALCVFFFHAKIPLALWSDEASAELLRVTSHGFIGVDVFFVISGFIMAWVTVLSGRPHDKPLAFATKRFFRVAPPYWIATAVALYLLTTGNTAEQLQRSFMFLPLSNEDPPFYGYALLTIGWTLNYEMLFYALFCAALLFGRFALAAVCAAICGLVIAVPILCGADGLNLSVLRPVNFTDPWFSLATNPLLLEFVLGIVCAAMYAKLRGRTPKTAAGALLAIGAAMMAWAFNTVTESGLQAGIPAAVLLLGAVLVEDVGLLKVPRVAVWLGEISFSFYLVHAAIVSLILYKVPPPLGSAGTYGKLFFMLAIILIVAHHWHRFIEMPSARLGVALAARINQVRASGD
ncbi:acyltransferase family protein [Brucella sp. 2716]|uniref:acyltransferase family protein n=1 Tax=Brucella sp. 2716 TaxID=2975052 RepID=UPI00217EFFB4|nr:acyltransferase [Brucella sp. 2716]UWF59409.1 acyltransferase [Brucella sp. 2716]